MHIFLEITVMSLDAIQKRRSIRKFQQKAVPMELINKILDAGRAAPSAKNRQPWHYIVFAGKHKKELLDAMEDGLKREERGITDLPKSRYGLADARNTLRIMKEAPVIIIVMNTNGKSPFLSIDHDERITEICDSLAIGAAVENMLLAAEELGLGALWIANTCFAYRELISYLHTDKQLACAIAIGYANEQPDKRPRKPFDEIVEYRL
ncbi:MAG: nitroreductase family protein [Clostridium sp.]|nr:nitroreductase family protein [Clostridium sp.]